MPDYKFYCFGGKPKLCQIITGRHTEEKIDFYDMDWNCIKGLVGLNPSVENSGKKFSKPLTFEKMKDIARTLSVNLPFSRVDLYEINGQCYFGEITFYPASGTGLFRPNEWNTIIGDWIKLNIK